MSHVDMLQVVRTWLNAPRQLTMQESETLIGFLVGEVDRLRAELDEHGIYVFRDLGGKAAPEGTPYGVVRTALRTRQVDITMQEDVRANVRRLVEVDDAGNVVREFTEVKP